jgi:hypothetical protein
MALAPLPDALHGVVSPEVIPVLAFVQPAALKRGLAGPPTIGTGTIKLSEPVPVIRQEELPAMAALTTKLL